MADGIKITGAKEFQGKLRLVRERAPDRIAIQLLKMGRKLRVKAKEKTPVSKDVKTRHLKDQYKLSEPDIKKDISQITMTNTAPHFHLVEKGHIVTKNGKKVGKVDGKFMVERSMQEMEEEMPAEVDAWLNDLFKELLP